MNYREMLRLAGDPAAVRASARSIRTILGDERLNDWERQFLAKLEAFEGPDLLSMRQRETLYALRSRATRRSVVKGFRASTLIKKLWEQRLDLSEDAEEFIAELHELGPDVALSHNQWRYVFALCHQVGEIERYVDIE
jgi:hypothetical protein